MSNKHRQWFWKDDDGEFRWHDYPEHVKVAHCGQTYSESKPLESLGASVHPSQVVEMNQLAKQHGLTGLRYRDDGMALFTSREHRAKYLKLNGLIDKSGGYKD